MFPELLEVRYNSRSLTYRLNRSGQIASLLYTLSTWKGGWKSVVCRDSEWFSHPCSVQCLASIFELSFGRIYSSPYFFFNSFKTWYISGWHAGYHWGETCNNLALPLVWEHLHFCCHLPKKKNFFQDFFHLFCIRGSYSTMLLGSDQCFIGPSFLPENLFYWGWISHLLCYFLLSSQSVSNNENELYYRIFVLLLSYTLRLIYLHRKEPALNSEERLIAATNK